MLQGVVVVVLTAAGVSGTPAEAEVPTRWMPAVGTSWQWQLDGRLNFGVDAAVYDIDGFEATAADVSKLHGLGRKAVCYIDVGAGESYRPDYKLIPTSVLGRPASH